MTLRIGVDVGGTFTDFAVTDTRSGQTVFYKRPSTPAEPHRAIVEGLEEALAQNALSASAVEALLHGTTVGTNALIQRRVGKVAVVTSEGFKDLLEIGRQTRPKVYDIHEDYPPPLVPRDFRFEIPERMRADGQVHVPLDEKALTELAPTILASGADCVVVCFLHSYAFPAHEKRAVEVLRAALPPELFVIASTDIYPEFREYERFTTAVLNGALLTVIDRYLDRLTNETSALGVAVEPRISHGSGGLMSVEAARKMPIRASLSGPAAGISAVLHTAGQIGKGNIITLDVGGTSSDVAMIRDFAASEIAVQDIGGFPVRLPAIDVTAVGAGGGTIAWIDSDELLKVGPISAGADPGPACYGRGGQDATVTDANVCLGRLNPVALLDGRMPIDAGLSRNAIAALADRLGFGVEQTARGILRVAAATVVKALRKVSVERGHDPADFALFAFGGAGPLMAIDVAREVGISTVVVPVNPGLMCAEGLQYCALMNDFVRSALWVVDDENAERIVALCADLYAEALQWFIQEGIPSDRQQTAWRVELRYLGQNFELTLPVDADTIDRSHVAGLCDRFHAHHEATYGFASRSEPVELVSVKLKVSQRIQPAQSQPLPPRDEAEPVGTRPVMFGADAWIETPIYRRTDLAPLQRLTGPAVIEQQDATVLVYPDEAGNVDQWGNLVIDLKAEVRS